MPVTFVNASNVQPIANQEVVVATIAGPLDVLDAYVSGGAWADGTISFFIYATVGALRAKVAIGIYGGPTAARITWVDPSGTTIDGSVHAGGTIYDLVVFAQTNQTYQPSRPAPINATFAGVNESDVVADNNTSGAGVATFGGDATIVTAAGFNQLADVAANMRGLPGILFKLYASCGAGSVEALVASKQSGGPDAIASILREVVLPAATQYRLAVALAQSGSPVSVTASLATYLQAGAGGGGGGGVSPGLPGQLFTTNSAPATQWQFAGMVNVLDRGVKGDGIADDTAAIQATLTFFAGTGVAVWFPEPPAFYKTTAPLDIPDDTIIWGTSKARLQANIPGGASTDAVFRAVPPAVFLATTTVAPAPSLGSNQFHVAVAAGVVPGMYAQVAFAANGFQQQILKITNVVGTLITVERPLRRAYPNGSTVNFYASVPKNIRMLGNGMQISGTCVIYINIVSGRDCQISGFRCDPISGGASDAGIGLDIGAFRSSIDDCVVDASGGTAGNKSFALIGGEECFLGRLDAFNANVTSFGITDCIGCQFESLTGYESANGMSLASEGGPVGDTHSNLYCSFRGIDLTSCTTVGLALGDGTAYCNFDGVTTNNNATGIQLINTALLLIGNKFSNVTSQGNSSYGVSITAGCKKTSFVNLDVSNNTLIGLLTADEVVVQNLIADSSATAGFVLDAAAAAPAIVAVDGFLIKGFASPQYAIQVNAGRCELSNGDISLSGGSIGIGALAGVVSVHHTNIEGGGGAIGLLVNGGTARIGDGFNADGATTPVNFTAGFINRAQVVINGAVPVVIPWPDLKSTDRVELTLTIPVFAGAQTLAAVVRTPGVGFTVTGFAGDTSTYDWVVF
jgi:hypothetical protein